MIDRKFNKTEIGSISPNYYVNNEFPNKVFTIRIENELYVPDRILNYNTETKILIYEDRVKGCFLDLARKLTKEQNSELIVLMICINYLEENQQFREGKSSDRYSSSNFLKRALKRIFSKIQDDVLDIFLNKVRHGLFHDAMIRKGVILQYYLDAPLFSATLKNGEKWIKLDPALFLREILIDFDIYINILKNRPSKVIKENFEKYWLWEEKQKVVHPISLSIV